MYDDIYLSRLTAARKTVTYKGACRHYTYEYHVNQTTKKKGRQHPDHLFVNRDERVGFRLDRTSSSRQVGPVGQVPQTQGDDFMELGVFIVELGQLGQTAVSDGVVFHVFHVEQPALQRKPSLRRVLFVVVHLLGHVVYTSGEGLPVRPYVPARQHTCV